MSSSHDMKPNNNNNNNTVIWGWHLIPLTECWHTSNWMSPPVNVYIFVYSDTDLTFVFVVWSAVVSSFYLDYNNLKGYVLSFCFCQDFNNLKGYVLSFCFCQDFNNLKGYVLSFCFCWILAIWKGTFYHFVFAGF